MAEKVVERRVTGIGVGRPDYSAEVWRGKIIKRVALKPDECLLGFPKCFSTEPSEFAFVVPPLAPDTTARLIDPTTGLDTPYTIPEGFELEILMYWQGCDQNTRNRMYLDGQLTSEYYYPARTLYYESEVFEFSSKYYDPLFGSHTITFEGTNLGAADMHGYIDVVCILRAHRTEKPKTKTVKCKHCGAEAEVPVATTLWICPKCGKTTRFLYFPWGG